jgi:hypothetical protein
MVLEKLVSSLRAAQNFKVTVGAARISSKGVSGLAGP